jgi:hypothetical protein
MCDRLACLERDLCERRSARLEIGQGSFDSPSLPRTRLCEECCATSNSQLQVARKPACRVIGCDQERALKSYPRRII